MRQRQRERETAPRAPAAELHAPRPGPDGEAAPEAAETGGSGVLRLRIRTTVSGAAAVELAATGDTTVGEVLDHACNQLGLGDPARYALVARGEMLGDRGMGIGTLAREGQGEDVAVRLVRRPEAGCPS